MGHLHIDRILELPKMANGIKIHGTKIMNCEACALTKQTRHSFHEKQKPEEMEIGAELNVDLAFINKTSILFGTDTGSGCMLMFILNNKSKALTKIVKMVRIIEKQYNLTV
jgi:hypothetical protein